MPFDPRRRGVVLAGALALAPGLLAATTAGAAQQASGA
jgi:hypothetical protein